MQCQSCGTEIQSGVTKCPSCGAPISLETPDNSVYEPDNEAIPYIAYGSLSEPSLAPPASASSSPESPPPAFSTQPTSDVVPPPQEAVPEKAAQRHGILKSTSILLLILALLIVVGGGAFTTYATIVRPLALRAQATAISQNIVTAQVQATAHAHTNSPQNLYNQTINTSPPFSDPLDGQHNSPWTNRSKGNTGCAFTNGAYHIRIAPQDFYSYCLATGSNYKNFLFQVQMTIIKGLDGGIVFRTADPNLPSYVYTITYNGLYALNVSIDAQHGRILAFGRSPAINFGLKQPNLLGVMANNGNISLFINKHFVTSVSDSSYASGAIGFVASNFPRTAIDIAFNNVQVWNLP